MATTLQTILDRLDAILQANVPAGCQVFRDRADPESRAEAPAVNVLAEQAEVQPASDDVDEHQLTVDLVIYVRTDPGAMAADDVHGAVHGAIVGDATLATVCESRRLVAYQFEREQADGTSTKKRATYRFKFRIPSTTL